MVTASPKPDDLGEIALDAIIAGRATRKERRLILVLTAALVIGVAILVISTAIFADNKGFERGRAYERSLQTQTITQTPANDPLVTEISKRLTEKRIARNGPS